MDYTLDVVIGGDQYTFSTSAPFPWIAVDYDGSVTAFRSEPIGRIDWGKWWSLSDHVVIDNIQQYCSNWEELCWHLPSAGDESHRVAFDRAMEILG